MQRVIRKFGLTSAIAIAFVAWLNAAGPAPVADAAMARDGETVKTLLKSVPATTAAI